MKKANANILIITSENSEAETIQNTLGAYPSVVSRDLQEAFVELKRNPEIKIVILDSRLDTLGDDIFINKLIDMEMMDGLHLIVISDGNDLEKEEESIRNGAIACLRRPINTEMLSIMVQRQLVLTSLKNLFKRDYQNKGGSIEDKIIELGNELLGRERLFRTLFEQANLGITIGHNGRYMDEKIAGTPTINEKFQKIVGMTYDQLKGITWEEITHPDDIEEDRRLFMSLWNGEIDDFQMEKRYVRPDGSLVWVDMKICRLVLDNLEGFNYIVFVEDISKRKLYEENLRSSEQRLSVLLSNLPGMAYRCKFDKYWTMEFVSNGCKDLTGYEPRDLVDNRVKSFSEIILPKYREHLWEKWENVVNDKGKLAEEYEIMTSYGEVKWVFEQGQATYDENGNFDALEGLIIDISERKRNELELKYINEHDPLTGMYNRRYLAKYLKELKDHKNTIAIVSNIKNFNLLNLTYGYSFSEDLIRNLSQGFTDMEYQGLKIFQVSIDRFVFLVEKESKHSDIEKLCWKIVDIMDQTITVSAVHGYVGVVKLDEWGRDIDNILKYGSIAAKTASESQTDRFCFFNHEMETRITRLENIKRNLDDYINGALKEGLYMVYQPIIDSRTMKVYGFEALARFKSPELGLVSPLEFIEIAENNRLIVPLGEKILRKSFAFLKECERNGFADLTISINISIIQLLRDDFVSKLKQEADNQDVDLNKINLELTESVFSGNYDEINKKLNELKELGVDTAIDDFGTGYSSLSRERELEIKCLKIDKAFIAKLEVLEENKSITSDIISLAHKLGHCVVAEGVETKNQMDYLRRNGCDYLQGFYFSKPLSEEKALDFLNKKGFNPKSGVDHEK